MLRWESVKTQEVYGMNVKMYCDPFVAKATTALVVQGLELDHYAYDVYGSELFAYRILDVNFIRLMEERGEVSSIGNLKAATIQNKIASVY